MSEDYECADELTLHRPPTPVWSVSDASGSDCGSDSARSGIVPAQALLAEHERRSERELPRHAKESRLKLVLPVLVECAARESHNAIKTGSTGFTVRVYIEASFLKIGTSARVSYNDGYRTPLPLADIVAALKAVPELKGYVIEDTLVGIRFTAAKPQ